MSPNPTFVRQLEKIEMETKVKNKNKSKENAMVYNLSEINKSIHGNKQNAQSRNRRAR